MINGGHATVYVSNMDDAIRFYTELLGLKLTNRFGNHWATVQAGKTLLIGLHPWSAKYPRPGTKGSVQIGLVVSRDEPIGDLAARLRKHGVEVSDIIKSEEANYISSRVRMGTRSMSAIGIQTSKRNTSHTTRWALQHPEPARRVPQDPAGGFVASVARRNHRKGDNTGGAHDATACW